jgi:hypothetical protein
VQIKITKQLPLAILFAFVHLIFILHLHHESCEGSENHWLLALLLVLPVYFLLPFRQTSFNLSKTIKNTAVFSVGFIITVLLQGCFSVVIASCLVASIFTLISELKKLKLASFQSVLYAGTFGGMVSSYWVSNGYQISISCVLGGVIYSLLDNSLSGFGGKMGSIGFASLIIWVIGQW